MLGIEPLQALVRVEKDGLDRPHGQPQEHHGDDLAGEIQPVDPKRLIPCAGDDLGEEEHDESEEDVVVVPCCLGRLVPAFSPTT